MFAPFAIGGWFGGPIVTATVATFETALNHPISGTMSACDADGNALTFSIVANGSKGVVVITNAATGA
ncbi:MAG: hypothetical protein ACJ8CR_19090, partial [Roseiflexaceae bacterium]